METEAAVNFAKATSGRLSSFSNALVGRGSGTPQAGGVSGFDSLRFLQHGRPGDGAWQTFCAYFPLEARLVPTEQKPNSGRRDGNTRSEFAKSNPRLGHAALRIRQGKPLREDKPAAGYVLEPRPTKAVEDEDSLPDVALAKLTAASLSIAKSGRRVRARKRRVRRGQPAQKTPSVPLDTYAVWPMYEY